MFSFTKAFQMTRISCVVTCGRRIFILALASFLLHTTILMPAHAEDARPSRPQEVRVLATTYPVYVLTRAVTRNSPDIRVDLLIPAQTGCPHDYALTPEDMRALADARIVVLNGLGMETFLEDALAGTPSLIRIDSSRHVDVLKDDANPHAFASPLQAAAMVRVIGRELGMAAPEAARACPTTAEDCAARLEALAQRLAAVGATATNTKVVLLHDGLAYLVRDAGLHLAGVIQEDGEAPPNAARLLTLARRCREDKPALLIGETQYSDKPLRALAAETDIPVVLLDSLASGPADPPADYYETVMRQNCTALEHLLAP